MTGCSVRDDEINHDEGRGRWAPIESLFDCADEVEDLPIEMPLHPSKNIVNGKSLQDWMDKPL